MIPKRYSALQRHQFLTLFDRDPCDFFDAFTGLDVIKLDKEVIKPADGESTQEKLQREWGDEAVTLVQELMSI